jgi:hypothetical protein
VSQMILERLFFPFCLNIMTSNPLC